MTSSRTGLGFDSHPADAGRSLRLGGIEIDGPPGLAGHSDGDALCHALADGLLGAAGLDDVGTHFPDSDASLAGISGVDLLSRTVRLVAEAGFRTVACDVTVVTAAIRIADHREEMRAALAPILGVDPSRLAIKGKRPEGMGLADDGALCIALATVEAGRVRSVGGKRAVLEALRAGRVREVFIARGAQLTPGLREVLEAAEAAGVPVRRVPAEDLGADRDAHRGVLARLRADQAISSAPGRRRASSEDPAVHELSERDLEHRGFGREALVVVLDGITDPQNLGAAARVADAAGAEMLVTRRRRAAPVTDAAVRASAGALVSLPHAQVANITRALERLQRNGFTVIGLDARADESVYDAEPLEGRVAIVVGAEDTGLSRLVRERCDRLVSLPMHGRVGSLNAAAALAATLYAFVLPNREAAIDRG